jgi:hypothetical protein
MRKSIAILPLATSLAALSTGASAVAPTDAPNDPVNTQSSQGPKQDAHRPNVIFNAGGALLGLIVSQDKNGSVVAQHVSHESHSYHGSHASHTSSS